MNRWEQETPTRIGPTTLQWRPSLSFLRYLERQESPRGIEGAHLFILVIQAPLREPILVFLKAVRPSAPPEVRAASPTPPLLFATPSSIPSQIKFKLATPVPMFPPASRAGATIWAGKVRERRSVSQSSQPSFTLLPSRTSPPTHSTPESFLCPPPGRGSPPSHGHLTRHCPFQSSPHLSMIFCHPRTPQHSSGPNLTRAG